MTEEKKSTETTDDLSIEVSKIAISPSDSCPLDSKIKVDIEFTANAIIQDAWWDIKYIVDSCSKRHVIDVHSSSHQKYSKGKNEFSFSAESIDVKKVSKNTLLNVGLFSAKLMNGTTEIMDIKMVTQVTKDSKGNLIRTIFNPL